MSERIRTSALVATAFLAGLFAAGSVAVAQQPCVTPVPPIGNAPSSSATSAIDWFKTMGVDQNESISSGFWSAMDTSDNRVTSASIFSFADQLSSVLVNQSDFSGTTGENLPLLQLTVDHFVPAASSWFANVRASTAPGQEATQTFGNADVTYSPSQIVGSPSGSVTITFH